MSNFASLLIYDSTSLSYLFFSSRLIFYLKAKEDWSFDICIYFFRILSPFFLIIFFSSSIARTIFLYFYSYFSVFVLSIFNLTYHSFYICNCDTNSSRSSINFEVIFYNISFSFIFVVIRDCFTISNVSGLQFVWTSRRAPLMELFYISYVNLLLIVLVPRSSRDSFPRMLWFPPSWLV